MDASSLFTEAWCQKVFPPERTEEFFDALFGGAEEGAYDIILRFIGVKEKIYEFCFELQERPGKCLVCSLTKGLPHVFSRHPVINVKSIVDEATQVLQCKDSDVHWELLPTRETPYGRHSIPLLIHTERS